jgi:hypothetical protein
MWRQPAAAEGDHHARRRLLRRLLPPVIGVGPLAAVAWVVQPADVMRAFRGFRAVVLLPLVLLLLLAYLARVRGGTCRGGVPRRVQPGSGGRGRQEGRPQAWRSWPRP